MSTYCAGVDLGKYKSAIALLYVDGRLAEPSPFYCNTLDLYEKILDLNQEQNLMAGIDAPLSLPAEGNCRECERKLLREGISIYPAGAGFFKEITLAGINLKNRLEQKNIPVIEIYPYASRMRLKIGVGAKKRKTDGRRQIQSDLARYIPNLTALPVLGADFLDALIGAYTVYLHSVGKSESIIGDGEIIVPRSSQMDFSRFLPYGSTPLTIKEGRMKEGSFPLFSGKGSP